MMETLFELRDDKGFCKLFDFFEDAIAEKFALVKNGRFGIDDLFITRVVTE